MTQEYQWLTCQKPEIGDIVRWNEPLWAVPNKPRGKPDKIGEQQIDAELMASVSDTFELKVLSVEKLSDGDAQLKVKADDIIRRKKTSLQLGNCRKRI